MTVKVCHISTAHPAFDIRIFYKECRSLANAGYDVNLVITHDKEETVEGVHIIPLPQNQSRSYRFLKKKEIALEKALRVDAAVYHFHDPELIGVGKKLKKMGKTVIYDAHEDVPKQILTKEWIKPAFRKIIANIFNAYEKNAVKYFDRVITARPDIAESFPKDKAVVLRNMPILNMIDSVPPRDITPEKPIVIYTGGLTKIRGIKEMIQGIGLLEGKAELWIFGKFDDMEYKKECENEYGFKFTRYMGWVTPEEAYSYMKKASMGIVNFLPAPNHVTTQPNKPFEYMTCSLPMVMSNFEYWKQLFGDCAVFANPKEPKEIANAINYILDNKEEAQRMAENGRNYIENNYSWEAESKILIKTYKELV